MPQAVVSRRVDDQECTSSDERQAAVKGRGHRQTCCRVLCNLQGVSMATSDLLIYLLMCIKTNIIVAGVLMVDG